MSARLTILNLLLRLVEKPKLVGAKTADDLRKPFEQNARRYFRAPRNSRLWEEELQWGDQSVPALWTCVQKASEDQVILYFHGGGYVFGSPHTHHAMLARLSEMTGVVACLPQYRLAPENPFPAAVNDALTAYRSLLDRKIMPSRIIIGGDSAGGGLALALLGEITARSLPQPAGVFAFSPLTDLTFSGASVADNEKADVVLPAVRAADMADLYLRGADPDDPQASPLRAIFADGTPVFLTASDSEILLDDTLRMTVHLRGQGASVTELIVHNHPHVWQIFQRLLPEADQGLRDVAAWIKPLLWRSGES